MAVDHQLTHSLTTIFSSFFNDDGSSNMFLQRALARVFAPVVGGKILTVHHSDTSSYAIKYLLNDDDEYSTTHLVVPALWAGGNTQDDFVVEVGGGSFKHQIEMTTTEGRVLTPSVEIAGFTDVFVTIFKSEDNNVDGDGKRDAGVVITVTKKQLKN